MEICIDFDGTCVTHDYPDIGKDIGAQSVLRELIDSGHNLILFTMRSGQYLDDAVNWFTAQNIPLYGVNKNPTQHKWTDSPKAYGHLYIDDAGVNTPLLSNRWMSSRPYVDWSTLRSILVVNGIINIDNLND